MEDSKEKFVKFVLSKEPTKEELIRLSSLSDGELLKLSERQRYMLGTPDGNGGRMVPFEGDIKSIRSAIKVKFTTSQEVGRSRL